MLYVPDDPVGFRTGELPNLFPESLLLLRRHKCLPQGLGLVVELRIEESRGKIDPHNATAVSDLADHGIGEVTGRGTQGPTVGVTGYKRLFRHLAHLGKRGVGKVRDIHHHPELLGELDKPYPLLGEQSVFAESRSGKRVVLPSWDDIPYPELKEVAQVLGIVSQGVRTLQADQRPDGTAREGALQVAGREDNCHLPLTCGHHITDGSDHCLGTSAFLAWVPFAEHKTGKDLAFYPRLQHPGKRNMSPSLCGGKVDLPVQHPLCRITMCIEEFHSLPGK